ncbi:MAG: beta-N-acetylhexosaminidase [Gemmatimonadota bacterium]
MMRRPATVLALITLAACASIPRPAVVASSTAPLLRTEAIIPMPVSVRATATDSFAITDSTRIVIPNDAPIEVQRVARQLSALLAPAAAGGVTRLAAGEAAPPRSILLSLAADTLGDEGYTVIAGRDGVQLRATTPAGLFAAVQTLRQLLPVGVEYHAATARRLVVPGVRIDDRPRYAWRGAMLDVARHFLPADDVKHFIDGMALYKLNRLHLHLSDDQGWRIEIMSWPNLTAMGGRSQVGGGYGGSYTQAEYADLVAYAAERYITIVPEIDMPSHINAALASYPQLNCDDRTPPLYTGTRVGFSLLCVSRESTYRFIDDVVREIAELTPGPYFHIGGDEVEKLGHAEYLKFVERVEGIVRAHGKRTVGWAEIAAANLSPETIAQHWRPARTTAIDSSHMHAARGGQILLSPAQRTYLDMKYDSSTVLGYTWAAIFDVRDSYDWNPDTFLPGVSGRSVLGVEGPLWSETIERRSDFEYMAFPRLVALAEVGWSRQADRGWDGFRVRLGNHAQRLSALGINFHRSSRIPWRE